MNKLISFFLILIPYFIFSQVLDTFNKIDTFIKIDNVIISEKKLDNGIDNNYLKSVEQFAIYAGKKTDIISIDKLQTIKARSVGRQIYAKVAGLNILESDASGLQLDIATRGLDPNRSSSFNIRQNGYDMSADALGYPDAYYTPPTDAVDRIEIVRGAASLQYGTQFGGLINFKLKDGANFTQPIHISLQQTAGLYKFYNTFNSIGGNYKKINYYSFYQYRRGESWRPNATFQAHNAFINFTYNINEKISLNAQYTYMHYIAQQPGGLTDNQFEQDASASNRSRNYFKVNWNLWALLFKYKITAKSQISSQFFGLIAGRDAIGNLNNIQQQDVLGTPRNYFKDKYKNVGNETKWMYKYKTTTQNSFVLLVGARFYKGFTNKRQDLGDSTSAANFNFLNKELSKGSDYRFPSFNTAIFAEHLFTIGKISITPGIRYENIQTKADGKYREITTFNDVVLKDTTIFETRVRKRNIFLAGIGISYKPKEFIEIYSNISQNYRAINFNDIRISLAGLRVDENIQDEKGYSFDFGFRGVFKNIINYNLNIFYLSYNNRISEVIQKDTVTFAIYRYRTNIAKSRAYGIDISSEIDFLKISDKIKDDFSFKLFVNFSYLNAQYKKSAVHNLANNKVEYAPNFIIRNGISFSYKTFNTSLQSSYISKQFSDASNASTPTVNAVSGIIPAYYVLDFSASYTIKWCTIKANINNLSNHKYFTRRTAGYPGPGIIPAEPINFLATLIFDWSYNKK
jgi:Fe(3+) dicitrate transport protein